jgi:FkbM family methyltransferase
MSLLRAGLRLFGRQDYLRFGLRDRVIRFFHNPDRPDPTEFVVDFYGRTYRGRFDTFLDWSVYYYGAYAKDELELIRDLLELCPGAVVFDVGANVGHHSLFASIHSRRVYAFEPLAAVAQKLGEKIRDNRLDNIELVPVGLGAESAVVDFYPSGTTNTGIGSFVSPAADRAAPVRLTIEKGDDVADRLGLDRLDLIKMDVEGYEPQALKGLAKTLARFRPVVFFEWTPDDPTGTSPPADHFFPEGYRFFHFRPESPRLVFFSTRTYRLEPLRPGDRWPGGNLLALPREYLDRLRQASPTPALARHLGALSEPEA